MENNQNQEKIMQLQIIAQEAQQLEQQLQLIEQHIEEMIKLKEGLKNLEEENNKEILANIGKGIYIPAEIKSKELLVEVGNKNLVKKTIPETAEIMEEQTKRLILIKEQIIERIESLQMEMNQMMQNDKGD